MRQHSQDDVAQAARRHLGQARHLGEVDHLLGWIAEPCTGYPRPVKCNRDGRRPPSTGPLRYSARHGSPLRRRRAPPRAVGGRSAGAQPAAQPGVRQPRRLRAAVAGPGDPQPLPGAGAGRGPDLPARGAAQAPPSPIAAGRSRVQGRVDGLRKRPDGTLVVEEIKSVRRGGQPGAGGARDLRAPGAALRLDAAPRRRGAGRGRAGADRDRQRVDRARSRWSSTSA